MTRTQFITTKESDTEKYTKTWNIKIFYFLSYYFLHNCLSGMANAIREHSYILPIKIII